MTSAAYLLFYQRRNASVTPKDFQEMISNYKAKSSSLFLTDENTPRLNGSTSTLTLHDPSEGRSSSESIPFNSTLRPLLLNSSPPLDSPIHDMNSLNDRNESIPMHSDHPTSQTRDVGFSFASKSSAFDGLIHKDVETSSFDSEFVHRYSDVDENDYDAPPISEEQVLSDLESLDDSPSLLESEKTQEKNSEPLWFHSST